MQKSGENWPFYWVFLAAVCFKAQRVRRGYQLPKWDYIMNIKHQSHRSHKSYLLVTLTEGERVSHLDPFVRLTSQNFRIFLCNRLLDWDEIFTIGAKCCHGNDDVIGHVVWQPCWKDGKIWTSVSLEISLNRTKVKIETWKIASTPHGEWVWLFFMMS